MTKIAVIGTQFGDEGKGKIIDLLAPNFDVVARYQGGCNAGHTQKTKDCKEIILHLLPSGILKPGIYNLLLSGVFVDPLSLLKEIKEIQGMGYAIDTSNFGISRSAHITLQYHKDFERGWEKRKGVNAVGTTMRGIGPTAVTKYAREGLRFDEFVNPEHFEPFLKSLVGNQGNLIAKLYSNDDVRKYLKMYREAQEFLGPFMVDEPTVVRQRKNDNWLYESAQGMMLDIDEGTYPYVTSSNPSRPPPDTDGVEGVAKAYITRVGGGYLPTGMESEEEKIVRGIFGQTAGAEYGATTGRPRNCGWFDGPIIIYSVTQGRVGKLHITKLDRLDTFPTIKICTGYKYRGSELKEFPADRYVFEKVEPIYKEVPGWEKDTTNAKEPEDLPQEAVDYLRRIEDITERKIQYVSNGQKAEQTIDFSGY